MSLKDLLPDGTYDEIVRTAREEGGISRTERDNAGQLVVNCPNCGKQVIYSTASEYRPFCSLRCKYIDLGAWADEERTIPGRPVADDDDGELLSKPDLNKKIN